MSIPVYTFTGFLESGKSKFVQGTLEDERFNAGEKTLLLICEEGVEEYDCSTYPHKNVYIERFSSYEDLSEEALKTLENKHKPERVLAELNGMEKVGAFYDKMPQDWEITQEVMFADATTIASYNANMRELVVDKLLDCEMVVFNRVEKGQDVMPLHKLARAVNRNVDIVYDYTDGTTEFDEIEDPLPFDVDAPVIEVEDEDFALFYRDISEEYEPYHGKTVHFKAQVARLLKGEDDWFAPGRFVMTCCEDDITFMALPCKWVGSGKMEVRSWVDVTATISVENHSIYQEERGPILTATSVTPTKKPLVGTVTF